MRIEVVGLRELTSRIWCFRYENFEEAKKSVGFEFINCPLYQNGQCQSNRKLIEFPYKFQHLDRITHKMIEIKIKFKCSTCKSGKQTVIIVKPPFDSQHKPVWESFTGDQPVIKFHPVYTFGSGGKYPDCLQYR